MTTPATGDSSATPQTTETGAEVSDVLQTVMERSADDAANLLEAHPPAFVVRVLQELNPSVRLDVLDWMDDARREAVLAAAPPDDRRQWVRNETYAEGTVGRLLEPARAVFRPGLTIAQAVEVLRGLVKRAFITYLFIVDEKAKLVGVVAMRELLLGTGDQRLEEIMIRQPFFLTPEMPLTDAMKSALTRHFPVYPVCEADGRLVGTVRGQIMFEAQAIELSAQPGTMVGVEKEERLATPWPRSLKFRHPWLQLNLLTAFAAAAVVGIFQHTIDRLVVLAVFLPVLAGQSGNTGCQALAVALRGMTLGELSSGRGKMLVMKEALLGLCNGALVGISAGVGMWIFATIEKNPSAPLLGLIVFMAMTASCVVSGVSGALVPLALKKLGADPATASSIFLTTATDVCSMGIFLGLATLLVR